MLQIVLRQNLSSFSALWILLEPCCPPTLPAVLRGAAPSPEPAPGKVSSFPNGAWGTHGSASGLLCTQQRNTPYYFLSVNIPFMALVMASKEAERQSAGVQGLSVASPRAGNPGEQRWLPEGWSENQNHAQIPKLLARAGVQATFDGLQKSCL